MVTLERLLIADGVLQKIIEEGYISEDKVEEFAEEASKTSRAHSRDFKVQMGLEDEIAESSVVDDGETK
jgi:hypothetical protein